jgi:hypothetical protein
MVELGRVVSAVLAVFSRDIGTGSKVSDKAVTIALECDER